MWRGLLLLCFWSVPAALVPLQPSFAHAVNCASQPTSQATALLQTRLHQLGHEYCIGFTEECLKTARNSVCSCRQSRGNEAAWLHPQETGDEGPASSAADPTQGWALASWTQYGTCQAAEKPQAVWHSLQIIAPPCQLFISHCFSWWNHKMAVAFLTGIAN